MAFDFPDSPAVGDEYVSGGATYTWTGLVWDLGGSATIDDKVDKAGDTMTGVLNFTAGGVSPFRALSFKKSDGAATDAYINLVVPAAEEGILEFWTANGGYSSAWCFKTTIANPPGIAVNNGGIVMDAGPIRWASNSAVATVTDFTKGICLYGWGGSSKFGFTITSGTLNYVVENAANKHNFAVGTENKLQIQSVGLFIPTVADNKNGYFIGDRFHGMYFHGGNKLVFTEYHDHFNWRRQTSGTGLGGDQRMTLIGGNLDAAGTVSTRAVIDRSLLEEYPDLESFAAGEDPVDSEIPQRGVNLGKLLLHALAEIKELKAEVAALKGRR